VLTHAGERYRTSGWELPWSPAPDAFAVNDAQRIELAGDQFRLLVAEPDCAIDLTWNASGPMFAYADEATVATAHYEGAGTVTGTVRLGGRTHDVDAIAFRDRSWGPRDYSGILAHRWFAGTFGPDLSFSAVTLMFADGRLHREAILVEDGRAFRTDDVDIVVHQEADAFTHRGGALRLRFSDHADFCVDARALDGIAFPIAGGLFHTVDTLCIADTGTRTGFCNVEVSNNLQNMPHGAPLVALAAAVHDGLTRRP
jgi:hypothetical protein